MPIKDINFRTSSNTGTATRETTGQGLAKLIMTGAQAYEKKLDIDRVMDAREEAELAKVEKMALNSKYLEHDTRRNQFISEGNKSSADMESFERELKNDMSSTFSEFNSEWSKTSSSTHIGSYDTAINNHFAKDLKLKTKNMYEEVKKSSSLNPDITMEELNSSIAFLNESSGITGDTYKISGALLSYSKAAMVDAESTNPLEFNEDTWRKKHKLLSEIEDPVLRDAVNGVAKTMDTKKKAVIGGMNTSYTDNRLNQIFNANNVQDLMLINKEILSDEVENPHITNQTRKPLLSYIRTLASRDGQGITSSEADYSAKNFVRMIKTDNKDTYEERESRFNYIRSNGINGASSAMNNLRMAHADSPQELEYKSNTISLEFSNASTDVMQIDGHNIGESIPENYTDVASNHLKERYSRVFTSELFNNPSNATNALISLGKFPKGFITTVDNAIVEGSSQDVSSILYGVSNIMKDPKGSAIANRNPKISAMIKAQSTLRNLDKIVPLLKELESNPDKKAEFNGSIIGYKKRLRASSDYDELSDSSINRMAEKLAYENLFSLRSTEQGIEDAEDVLEDMSYEESDARIFDVEGKYSPDELNTVAKIFNEKVISNISNQDVDTADRKPSINVSSDGGMTISYGSLVLYQADNKKEVQEMVRAFGQVDKAENPPNEYWNNTAKKISKNWSGIKEITAPILKDIYESKTAPVQWFMGEFDRINQEASDRRSGKQYNKDK